MTPPLAVLDALGLASCGWTALSGGMNAVWRRGEFVVERVDDPVEARAERLVLGAVRDLPVRVPTLLDVADHQGATWLMTSWLPGERLSQVWDVLDLAERAAAAEMLGRTLAAL